MQAGPQNRMTNFDHRPVLLAPDTTGMNFFRADPALADLLRIHLPEALFRHIEPHLDRLGGLAGGHLDECARLADRHVPVLHQRDRFGRDVQWIEYHPAYRELERAAFGEFGIHAMSLRKGIMGWPEKYPVVAKHAFTFLFNQAEFGLGCPINVTDGCAKLLANFGSEALKAKYLDGLLATDMDQLTQGGQFMTEKEGGSDVGTLTTTAVAEGDHWQLHGEKWFCSNADAKVVMLLARPEGAGPGTRGVGLFLMPRTLDDGSPNHYRIVRLKDKLGTRSMASGEIKLEGAMAHGVKLEISECDLFHVAIGRMVVDPVLVAAETIARVQHRRMLVGEASQFVEPAARHRAEAIEMLLQIAKIFRREIKRQQFAQAAI
jgi:hypothetical protein